MTKRLKWALIGGAVLGIICVVGGGNEGAI